MSERIAGSWSEQSVPDATKKYYRLFDTSKDSPRKGVIVFSDQQVQPKSILAGIAVNDGETVIYSQSLKKGRRDRRKLQTSLDDLRFPKFDDLELKRILKSFDRGRSDKPSRWINLFNRLDTLRRDGLLPQYPPRPFQ